MKKMTPDRANEIKLALKKIERLELTFDDFTKLKLPICAFECESTDEVNWLRAHARDNGNLKTKEKAKKAFLSLLSENRGQA
ncbi:hypothetical protein [Shewanella hanedai]|uniref:Uncharacterized protein n=1 Tax=Shewanella hanedai TaxID=25 RepID=A0A553JUZ2_SHEHA|nr:hypothetical protein [Shewanella hanedai]TRY16268.1 hypothetical protein FN961_01170 [Shewanella hanedai]